MVRTSSSSRSILITCRIRRCMTSSLLTLSVQRMNVSWPDISRRCRDAVAFSPLMQSGEDPAKFATYLPGFGASPFGAGQSHGNVLHQYSTSSPSYSYMLPFAPTSPFVPAPTLPYKTSPFAASLYFDRSRNSGTSSVYSPTLPILNLTSPAFSPTSPAFSPTSPLLLTDFTIFLPHEPTI